MIAHSPVEKSVGMLIVRIVNKLMCTGYPSDECNQCGIIAEPQWAHVGTFCGHVGVNLCGLSLVSHRALRKRSAVWAKSCVACRTIASGHIARRVVLSGRGSRCAMINCDDR